MKFDRIIDLRDELELTQRVISEKLGCTRSAYSLWELNKNTIPLDYLNRLSNELKVNIDYLVYLSDEKLVNLLCDKRKDFYFLDDLFFVECNKKIYVFLLGNNE